MPKVKDMPRRQQKAVFAKLKKAGNNLRLIIKRRGYRRKGYRRRDGTYVKPARVKATSYRAIDRGKPGRTPKGERWFNPETRTGWRKDMPQEERLRRLHKGGVDDLTAARRVQALANVTTDRETKAKARADAKILFERHKKGERYG